MGVASALMTQLVFLAKSALKMRCTTFFSRQKLLQITIRNVWFKTFFDRPKGLASALMAQFVFFVEKYLKNAFYKNCFQTKVVTKQNLQFLYYVTFFDILHHFGDIATYLTHRESIVPSYGTDFYFLDKVLRWSKKTKSRFWQIFTFWVLLSPKK